MGERRAKIAFVLCVFMHVAPFLSVNAVAIDNEISGDPLIECLDEEIRFVVDTKKLFAGRIYAKGKSEYPGCLRTDYANQRTTKPMFDLRFGGCGMRSQRSTDPRGMYYGVTLVVSFHPLFITKVDQAFHVKCFFEEANKGLTAELGVSMIPTTEVQARHSIPGCTYSIHRSTIRDLDAGGNAGPPIEFARVGDKVLHRWHCDDPMFGILINNCYVTDGNNKRADVVDNRGCPVDPILITGIRYSSDVMTAYAESHVFKFADRPGVWFFCKIQMCMKASGMCRGVTPPSCAGGVGPGPSYTRPLAPVTQPTYGGTGGVQSFTPFGPPYPSTNFRPFGSLAVDESRQEATVAYEANESPDQFPPGLRASFGQPATEIPFKFERFDSPGVTVEKNFSETSLETVKTLPPPKSDPDRFGPPIDQELPQNPEIFGPNQAEETENFGDFLQNLPADVDIEDLQRVFLDQADKRFLKNRLQKLLKAMGKKRLGQRRNREMTANNRRGTFVKANPNSRDFWKNGRFGNGAKRKRPKLNSGDRLGGFEVTWANRRSMADEPMDSEEKNVEKTGKGSENDEDDEEEDGEPEIAGQLIVFDLDEDPPSYMELSRQNMEQDNGVLDETSGSTGGEFASAGVPNCVISRGGLAKLVAILVGLMGCFVFATCFLAVRQRRQPKKSHFEYGQREIPYDRYEQERKREKAAKPHHRGRK